MNDVKARLKAPAMGLIAVGAVNALIGVLAVLQLLLKLINSDQTTDVFESDARRLGYLFGFFFWPLLMFLGTLISPLIIIGGIRMYAAKSYAMARLAAILALIPVTSCCFVIGIPVGIWSVNILRRPEVKAAFGQMPDGMAFKRD
jgi:hypothetical protein